MGKGKDLPIGGLYSNMSLQNPPPMGLLGKTRSMQPLMNQDFQDMMDDMNSTNINNPKRMKVDNMEGSQFMEMNRGSMQKHNSYNEQGYQSYKGRNDWR